MGIEEDARIYRCVILSLLIIERKCEDYYVKLSVIIPVYNEPETFTTIIERVANVPIDKEILVVDDGSAKSIESVVRRLDIAELHFFQHQENRGKGAAIRTALEHAVGDAVIIQDADTEYYPEDYSRLLEVFEKNKVGAVYGSRDLSDRSLLMRYGNYFVTFVTNLLYGSKLKDMETCYKVVATELMRSLELESRRFEIEAEISAKLLRLGVEIAQVPIRYDARSEGKKLSSLDGFPTIVMLVKCLFWKPKK